MDAIFKIVKSGPTGISIVGLELDNHEYLLEDGVLVSTRNYAYSHSVTLNMIKYIRSNIEGPAEFQVNLHKTDCIDESTFVLKEDGLIEVSHIIIPNKVWIDYVKTREPSEFNRYTDIIYYDNDVFYKYDPSTSESLPISTQDLVKLDYIPNTSIPTTIKAQKNTFNTYYLKNIYNILGNKYFDLICSKPKINHEYMALKSEIDTVFVCLKCIQFLIEDMQLYEAQKLMEDFYVLCSRYNNVSNLIKHGLY